MKPIEFTAEQSDLLCSEIATCTESLAAIVSRLQSEHIGFPAIASIYRRLRENNDFAEVYTRAKQDQSDLLVDEMIQISDDDSGDADGSVSVMRAKLKIETRKWIASKLKPKSYGDKLDVSGTINHEHSVTALLEAINPSPLLPGNLHPIIEIQQHEEAEI